MKKSILTLAMLFSMSAMAQITLDYEFFNSDPNYIGMLRTVYLSPDEVVYASWSSQNIYLYDLEYNLIQTIAVAAPSVNYIRYITRELFDCDPDNIEYMVLSGTWGNSLIEIYREDGTLLESIPGGSLMVLVPDQTNAFTFPIQATPEGTKLFVHMMDSGADESLRVYSLCGDFPVPCCMAGEPGGISGITEGITFQYSTASPNPTSGTTTIRLSSPLNESGTIKVYNGGGQVVRSVNISSGQSQVEIHLGDQPAGTYMYRIETPSGVKPTGKVVKY